jgi:hypothetical protein
LLPVSLSAKSQQAKPSRADGAGGSEIRNDYLTTKPVIAGAARQSFGSGQLENRGFAAPQIMPDGSASIVRADIPAAVRQQ